MGNKESYTPQEVAEIVKNYGNLYFGFRKHGQLNYSRDDLMKKLENIPDNVLEALGDSRKRIEDHIVSLFTRSH